MAGKLGDNVFWRAKGQQRVRTYVPRTETMVGYEAAERRARFANLKGIYQWLPEPFKQACSLHRIGGNSYADFMMQYNSFNEERMRSTFGAGRFLPVNCKISNGTLNVNTTYYVTAGRAYNEVYGEYNSRGVVIDNVETADFIDSVDLLTKYLIESNPTLREGDILHVTFGYVKYTTTPWGQPDLVEGFPFQYNGPFYAAIRLSLTDDRTIEQASGNILVPFCIDSDNDQKWGFAMAFNTYSPVIINSTSIVAALMFERPSAPRQQRFSPAQLMFDRSQKMILNADARGRWNDYCTRSFMKG